MLREIVRNRPLRIDLDNPSEYKLLRVYLNMKSVFGEVKIIKTKHGYHLIVSDVKSDMEGRYEFEDCPGRMYHSDLRGGDDVMFNIKGKVTKYEVNLFYDYEIDESNILSLPELSKVPRGYYVLKKIRKYGKRRRR